MSDETCLVLQEPLLAAQPAAVARERTPRADDTVTGDDDPDGIPGVREAHRAAGTRAPDATSQFPVADPLAEAQRPERRPDDLLKVGPLERDRQIEQPELSLEVRQQLTHNLSEGARVSLPRRFDGPAVAGLLHVQPGQGVAIRHEQQVVDGAMHDGVVSRLIHRYNS